jgi:hypothetical protein
MKRPFLWLAIAVAAAPVFAWVVYRLAKGLGFLDPPMNREHELRRTIVVAIYAFFLFLPVLFYGFEKRWPRAWVIFGFVDGLALLIFASSGVWSAWKLWRIRHPDLEAAPASGLPEAAPDDALAQVVLADPTPGGEAGSRTDPRART